MHDLLKRVRRRLGYGHRPLRDLARDRRGNVLMIFGFSLIPLAGATGMSIDYARAMRLQTKLNAAADAAVLATVSKRGMLEPTANAQYAAQQMFIAQSNYLQERAGNAGGGLIIDYTLPSNVTVNVVDTIDNGSVVRDTTLTFAGQSKNSFGGLFGISTLPIKGIAKANTKAAPNIDFYVMMDTSPSMLFPATTAGVTTMVNGKNCAFACHTIDPNNGENNYAFAVANNVTLRTDLVHTAVQNLSDLAGSTAAARGVTFRIGLSDFDYMFRQRWPTAAVNGYYLENNMTTVKSHVTDSQPLQYCANNQRVCGTNDNDTGTNFTAAFNGVNNMMVTPGNGSNQPGDKPQAFLFMITDGMRDEAIGGGRAMGPMTTAQCDAIKARGIKIAILNTQYIASSLDANQWSIDNVRNPYLTPTDRVTPWMQSCVSSPDLFKQVTLGTEIDAALRLLFANAVSSAHLTR